MSRRPLGQRESGVSDEALYECVPDHLSPHLTDWFGESVPHDHLKPIARKLLLWVDTSPSPAIQSSALSVPVQNPVPIVRLSTTSN